MADELVFHDPLSHRDVVLVIGADRTTTGVRHKNIEWVKNGRTVHGCAALAEVYPELDCASCSTCHWQCRISGAWFVDLLKIRA